MQVNVNATADPKRAILPASEDRKFFSIQASYDNTDLIYISLVPNASQDQAIYELGAGDILYGEYGDNLYVVSKSGTQTLYVNRQSNAFPYGKLLG